LVGKPEAKRPLGTSRRSWDDNIRIDLRETGWEGVDEMHLAEDTVKWQALENIIGNEPSGSKKDGTFVD
jgi:hypothetical protein